jgi:hypothetical protein
MKKNVFKLAYAALALVAMIAVRPANADDATCGIEEGVCLVTCQNNGWPAGCAAGCQNDYVDCERPVQLQQ